MGRNAYLRAPFYLSLHSGAVYCSDVMESQQREDSDWRVARDSKRSVNTRDASNTCTGASSGIWT